MCMFVCIHVCGSFSSFLWMADKNPSHSLWAWAQRGPTWKGTHLLLRSSKTSEKGLFWIKALRRPGQKPGDLQKEAQGCAAHAAVPLNGPGLLTLRNTRRWVQRCGTAPVVRSAGHSGESAACFSADDFFKVAQGWHRTSRFCAELYGGNYLI